MARSTGPVGLLARVLVAAAVVVAVVAAAAAAAAAAHGDAREKGRAGTRAAVQARFEASVTPFLQDAAQSFVHTLARNWAAHVAQGHDGERSLLPDVAVLARDVHRRHPLIVDLDYLGAHDACDDCKADALPLQQAFKSDRSKEFFAEAAKAICIRFELFAPYICNATVDIFTDIFVEIIAHSRLEPLEVCGDAGVCVVPDAPTWNVTFAREKPPVRVTPTPLPTSRRKWILHSTDVHYDPLYTPGLEGDCGDPLCCRPPVAVGTRRPAGIFGDFRCDAPRTLLVDVYDFIANRAGLPPIDYVVWTGDIPPHDVHESTREAYTALMEDQAQLLAEYFPSALVLGAIGNHESVPVDQFAPRTIPEPEFATEWLYDVMAQQWSRWLPADALTELRRAGSFTFLLEPGMRVVSLNDEGCSDNNFWLRMKKETGCCKNEYADPDNSLHWLVDVLQAAEDAGERVLMLRHIPNASRCNTAWSLNYHKIMVRFESTIIAMFTGHSHDDEFELFYRDNTRTEAAVVNYIGPAVTPYTDANPGIRVYELDMDTLDIVNTYTYVANLTAANEAGRLDWYLEYTATSLYNLPRLSAQDWHGVADRLATEPALFDQYYLYKYKSYLAPTRGCTGTCVPLEVCRLRTSYVGQPPCA